MRLEASIVRLLQTRPDGDDWWLIGSTAAYLSGIDLQPDDVDVLTTGHMARLWVEALGGGNRPDFGDGRFYSDPYARIPVAGGLDIEVMGDLKVHGALLRVNTRRQIDTAQGRVFVPELTEQAEIFSLFGRPKDLAKAALIHAHLHDR